MGAGPAGLTAAYELLKRDVPVTVVEKDPKQVGGLARTVEYRGYRFDIGGPRLLSKKAEIENRLRESPGDKMQKRGRLARKQSLRLLIAYPTNALIAPSD